MSDPILASIISVIGFAIVVVVTEVLFRRGRRAMEQAHRRNMADLDAAHESQIARLAVSHRENMRELREFIEGGRPSKEIKPS